MAPFEAEYDQFPRHEDENCQLLTCLAVSAPGKARIIRHRSFLLIVSISATAVKPAFRLPFLFDILVVQGV